MILKEHHEQPDERAAVIEGDDAAQQPLPLESRVQIKLWARGPEIAIAAFIRIGGAENVPLG